MRKASVSAAIGVLVGLQARPGSCNRISEEAVDTIFDFYGHDYDGFAAEQTNEYGVMEPAGDRPRLMFFGQQDPRPLDPVNVGSVVSDYGPARIERSPVPIGGAEVKQGDYNVVGSEYDGRRHGDHQKESQHNGDQDKLLLTGGHHHDRDHHDKDYHHHGHHHDRDHHKKKHHGGHHDKLYSIGGDYNFLGSEDYGHHHHGHHHGDHHKKHHHSDHDDRLQSTGGGRDMDFIRSIAKGPARIERSPVPIGGAEVKQGPKQLERESAPSGVAEVAKQGDARESADVKGHLSGAEVLAKFPLPET